MTYRMTILAGALALISGLAVAQTSLQDALASPWLHYGKQDQVWDMLDFNRDGQLSQYEWELKGFGRNWKSLLSGDLDKDGVLSRLEYQLARQDLAKKSAESQVIVEKAGSPEQLKEFPLGSLDTTPENPGTLFEATEKERHLQAKRRDAMKIRGFDVVRPIQQVAVAGFSAGR